MLTPEERHALALAPFPLVTWRTTSYAYGGTAVGHDALWSMGVAADPDDCDDITTRIAARAGRADVPRRTRAPRRDPELWAAVRDDVRAGLGVAAIAARRGCSATTVCAVRRDLGVSVHRQRSSR